MKVITVKYAVSQGWLNQCFSGSVCFLKRAKIAKKFFSIWLGFDWRLILQGELSAKRRRPVRKRRVLGDSASPLGKM